MKRFRKIDNSKSLKRLPWASIKALELAITRQEAAIKALEVNLTRDIREMEHKLTIKLGAFLVIGVTVLTLFDRLL